MSLVKELGHLNAIAYRHEDFARAAAMPAGRPEIAAALAPRRFPLARAPDAFRVAADRSADAVKAVCEPGL